MGIHASLFLRENRNADVHDQLCPNIETANVPMKLVRWFVKLIEFNQQSPFYRWRNCFK